MNDLTLSRTTIFQQDTEPANAKPGDLWANTSAEDVSYVKQASIASEFSSTSTYSIGDIVTYRGVRYRCKEDIETAEVWNPSKWDAESVQTVLDAIRNEIFNTLYPIGSYSFGQHPNFGTWTEITGDRALWLKSSAADGSTIAQALPNITGTLGGAKTNNTYGSNVQFGHSGGSFSLSGGWGSIINASSAPQSESVPGEVKFNAHNSNAVYQDGANVQPNAYVMKVYKRTA